MQPDVVNALFEFCGAVFMLNHCRVILKDKQVAGVSILSAVFFLSWGAWNLFYYPHLDQWYSFYGGVCISVANAFYIWLLMYYKFRKQ